MSAYMFDASTPRYLRALSLFHVPLPAGLVWLVARLGYDRRAWLYQSLLALVVLPVTYWLTGPKENVNWVHGLGKPQTALPPGRTSPCCSSRSRSCSTCPRTSCSLTCP